MGIWISARLYGVGGSLPLSFRWYCSLVPLFSLLLGKPMPRLEAQEEAAVEVAHHRLAEEVVVAHHRLAEGAQEEEVVVAR